MNSNCSPSQKGGTPTDLTKMNRSLTPIRKQRTNGKGRWVDWTPQSAQQIGQLHQTFIKQIQVKKLRIGHT
jgi:hypothetical protein